MDYYKIGQRIRKYRKENNLSQEELASLVDISTTHMSHIETGNTKLSLPVLVKISTALSVRIDTLLCDELQSDKNINQDIYNLIDTCSTSQKKVIIDLIKCLKKSFEKNL